MEQQAQRYVESGNLKSSNVEGVRDPVTIAISKTGERLVGLSAKRQGVTNPKNTLFEIKRLIGHSFEEDSVQRDKKIMPFAIEREANGGVKVQMNDKWYRPEEISGMILAKLKQLRQTRRKNRRNVITVPAYFNDSQRQATKMRNHRRFQLRQIIGGPTAAALAYGFDKKKKKIVVYDFGGGAFDVSVLEVETILR